MKLKSIFQIKNIPNFLTVFRIILVPIIIMLIFIDYSDVIYTINAIDLNTKITLNFILAGIFFCLASITDCLDGYLSRKFNWISEFGKIWDPVADKILVNSVLIAFSIKLFIPFYVVILMIMRDVIIDAYRLYAVKQNCDISAGKLGKLKTVFQMIGIIFIFFIFNDSKNGLFPSVWSYYLVQNLFIIIALFFSLYSVINYVIFYTKKIKEVKIN